MKLRKPIVRDTCIAQNGMYKKTAVDAEKRGRTVYQYTPACWLHVLGTVLAYTDKSVILVTFRFASSTSGAMA